nr:uncharacterized protein LOC113399642 [Vanessa tameamea]
MQVKYPKKLPPTSWDTVHLNYPVQKFPETGISSETLGRQWRPPPDILKALLADRTPAQKVHGTTEMKSSYTEPIKPCRLVTDKDQFKQLASLPLEMTRVEPFHKDIEPLDTTYEGFEKYLDPYLTTNRLHHRPFTSDVLNRSSNSKDILTYYIFSNTPWVRSAKPNIEEWQLPLSKPKLLCDKEKFKDDFREIRTHNKLNWVPRSFCTEARDNYIQQNSRLESRIHNYEEEVRSEYQRSIAKLQTSTQHEQSAMKYLNTTEYSHIGSRRPICSMIDQYFENNKKLAKRANII